MVQLNNYAWGHELLDLLMNQGKTKQQKKHILVDSSIFAWSILNIWKKNNFEKQLERKKIIKCKWLNIICILW